MHIQYTYLYLPISHSNNYKQRKIKKKNMLLFNPTHPTSKSSKFKNILLKKKN